MKRTQNFLLHLKKPINKNFLLLLVVLNFIGIIFSFLTYTNEFVDYANKRDFISMIFFPVSFWLYLLAFSIVLYKYLNKKIPKLLGGLAFVYCFTYGLGSLLFYPLFMIFIRGFTLYHAWNVLAHSFVGILSLLFLSWISAPKPRHFLFIVSILITKNLFDMFGKGFLYFIKFAFPSWLRASLILMIIGLQVTAFYLLLRKAEH